MKFLLAILIFITSRGPVFSQPSFTIRYFTYEPTFDTSRPLTREPSHSLLYIRDSLAYFYYIPYHGRDSILKSPLGGKFRGHSLFIDYSRREIISQSLPFGLPRYRVIDTLHPVDWKLIDEEILIAGYKCRKATTKINTTELTAFYAPDMPHFAGPSIVGGLPGTILEFWYENSNRITTAIWVKKDAMNIIRPLHGKEISRAEYNMKLEKLRKKIR